MRTGLERIAVCEAAVRQVLHLPAVRREKPKGGEDVKQWYYVKNREGYIVLENAFGPSDAKQRAASRPGFAEDTIAWPKACVPVGADNMTADAPKE